MHIVTPYGACVALSALAAILTLAFLRKRETGRVDPPGRVPVLTLALSCIPAAFVGARLLYCLFRFDFYFVEMGALSALQTWNGGFLLYGALIGASLAAACASRASGVSFADTLDELAVPGLLSVFICRLAEGFTFEGVGTWVEREALMRLPIAVQNDWGEWQLAVFLWEAAAAALILLAVYPRRGKGQSGERFMTALVLYACCQVVFESLRMDSCLRIGFVRVSQVLSGAAVFAVAVVRALRRGDRGRAVSCALAILACIGAAGGLEWALDKTAVPNAALYAAMIAVCALMAAIARLAGKTARREGAR